MAVAKQCDRCGKFYEATNERVFKTDEGFPINSVRLGDWDQKTRSWKSIGSAYDLCDSCGRKIFEVICGDDSNVKIHPVERKRNESLVPKKKAALTTIDVTEKEQNEFASLMEE